jgi:hypothetical protein
LRLVVRKPKEEREKSVTTQTMLSSRKVIVPVWLVVFALFALFASPMTFATGTLLFVAGVVPPLIMLVLSQKHSPTVAEVLHHAEGTQTKR